MRFTTKQRDTLLKITINASNAVLVGLVLESTGRQGFRISAFVMGLGLYGALIVAALLLDQ